MFIRKSEEEIAEVKRQLRKQSLLPYTPIKISLKIVILCFFILGLIGMRGSSVGPLGLNLKTLFEALKYGIFSFTFLYVLQIFNGKDLSIDTFNRICNTCYTSTFGVG
ncbi:MAG: hypothetical protein GY705_28160 [Bacteroidetes bacterium]|nr:hypothetical protein [Bacteroidota bacterium]